jgi:hypothetical protein
MHIDIAERNAEFLRLDWLFDHITLWVAPLYVRPFFQAKQAQEQGVAA